MGLLSCDKEILDNLNGQQKEKLLKLYFLYVEEDKKHEENYFNAFEQYKNLILEDSDKKKQEEAFVFLSKYIEEMIKFKYVSYVHKWELLYIIRKIGDIKLTNIKLKESLAKLKSLCDEMLEVLNNLDLKTEDKINKIKEINSNFSQISEVSEVSSILQKSLGIDSKVKFLCDEMVGELNNKNLKTEDKTKMKKIIALDIDVCEVSDVSFLSYSIINSNDLKLIKSKILNRLYTISLLISKYKGPMDESAIAKSFYFESTLEESFNFICENSTDWNVISQDTLISYKFKLRVDKELEMVKNKVKEALKVKKEIKTTSLNVEDDDEVLSNDSFDSVSTEKGFLTLTVDDYFISSSGQIIPHPTFEHIPLFVLIDYWIDLDRSVSLAELEFAQKEKKMAEAFKKHVTDFEGGLDERVESYYNSHGGRTSRNMYYEMATERQKVQIKRLCLKIDHLINKLNA